MFHLLFPIPKLLHSVEENHVIEKMTPSLTSSIVFRFRWDTFKFDHQSLNLAWVGSHSCCPLVFFSFSPLLCLLCDPTAFSWTPGLISYIHVIRYELSQTPVHSGHAEIQLHLSFPCLFVIMVRVRCPVLCSMPTSSVSPLISSVFLQDHDQSNVIFTVYLQLSLLFWLLSLDLNKCLNLCSLEKQNNHSRKKTSLESCELCEWSLWHPNLCSETSYKTHARLFIHGLILSFYNPLKWILGILLFLRILQRSFWMQCCRISASLAGPPGHHWYYAALIPNGVTC